MGFNNLYVACWPSMELGAQDCEIQGNNEEGRREHTSVREGGKKTFKSSRKERERKKKRKQTKRFCIEIVSLLSTVPARVTRFTWGHTNYRCDPDTWHMLAAVAPQ